MVKAGSLVALPWINDYWYLSTLPVLDIWGEAGRGGDNRYGLERKVLLSPLYIQVSIKKGDHALLEHEDELVEEVVRWLTMQDKINKGR